MHDLFQRASSFTVKTAIHTEDKDYSYSELIKNSQSLATQILDNAIDLNEQRVAYMVEPGIDYIQSQWAIWMAGGVAVPLCISYPLDSLAYVIEDTAASLIILSEKYRSILFQYAIEKNIRCIVLENVRLTTSKDLPSVAETRNAMILYTSGTTSKPKGVVTTHKNIKTQIKTLIDAWHWTSEDHTICVLPLHHVHGIINVVSCALWSGATLEFMPSFDAGKLFERFLAGTINVFMAVPTIYYKLIAHFNTLSLEDQIKISTNLSTFRLMVSGSAALPISVLEEWKKISRHTLLERYGMTEIGMAISNPYDGDRKPGYIGLPLPGVQVRLVDEQNNTVPNGLPGEIQIKGDTVFKEYWNKPIETTKAFTADAWFKTGDIAILEDGYYRILGRDSIDIIKSGGYKISALEIEEVLREYPSIQDCGVIGIPDEEWGEKVVAVLVEKEKINEADLINWIKLKMPTYKMPRVFKVIEVLPRNAMGKVTKPDLKRLFDK